MREQRFEQIDDFDLDEQHHRAAAHDVDVGARGTGRVPRDCQRALPDDEDANLRPR